MFSKKVSVEEFEEFKNNTQLVLARMQNENNDNIKKMFSSLTSAIPTEDKIRDIIKDELKSISMSSDEHIRDIIKDELKTRDIINMWNWYNDNRDKFVKENELHNKVISSINFNAAIKKDDSEVNTLINGLRKEVNASIASLRMELGIFGQSSNSIQINNCISRNRGDIVKVQIVSFSKKDNAKAVTLDNARTQCTITNISHLDADINDVFEVRIIDMFENGEFSGEDVNTPTLLSIMTETEDKQNSSTNTQFPNLGNKVSKWFSGLVKKELPFTLKDYFAKIHSLDNTHDTYRSTDYVYKSVYAKVKLKSVESEGRNPKFKLCDLLEAHNKCLVKKIQYKEVA